jgi:Domain of unknown function (DUF4351)
VNYQILVPKFSLNPKFSLRIRLSVGICPPYRSIGLERGRTEGEQALVLKLLTRKLGKIDAEIQAQVNSLTIDRVESLGEALLDFTSMADLERFLDS